MKPQRGSILVAVLPFALAAAAYVAFALTSTGVDLRLDRMRRGQARAYQTAESALAVAHAVVKTSEYDATGNVALHAALAGTPTGLKNSAGADTFVFWTGERAEVLVSQLEPELFQLDALARYGGATVHVRSLVRERDSFARYTLFVNAANVNLGGAVSDGRIHSNRGVRFRFPGHTYPTVTAVTGFSYTDGATPENTTLGPGSNDAVAPIPMPDLGDIQDREAYGDGSLEALLGGQPASNYRVSLRFLGNAYELKAVHKTTGVTLNSGPLPLPPEGVVYLDTKLEGLVGVLSGRVTLAVTGAITITGSLKYVDANGNPAYLNGTPADPALPYVPNPAYQGNAALGVMAGGDVLYGSSIGQRLELNGYFFSRGRFGVPNSSYGVRATLRSLGGHTVETGVVGAYVNSSGTVTAGFQDRVYLFDRKLADAPPPHFLALDEPRFSAVRVVEGTGRTGADEPDSWNLNDRPLGTLDGGYGS